MEYQQFQKTWYYRLLKVSVIFSFIVLIISTLTFGVLAMADSWPKNEFNLELSFITCENGHQVALANLGLLGITAVDVIEGSLSKEANQQALGECYNAVTKKDPLTQEEICYIRYISKISDRAECSEADFLKGKILTEQRSNNFQEWSKSASYDLTLMKGWRNVVMIFFQMLISLLFISLFYFCIIKTFIYVVTGKFSLK